MTAGFEPISVAVVIPVYNRASIIGQTLDSVLAQSRSPQRVIIVDDGSADGSAQAVEAWRDHRRPPFQVQVHSQPNAGPSAARETGSTLVGDCPLIAFLDSDDLWPVDFLEATCGRLLQRADAVAVARNYRIVWEKTDQTQDVDVSGFASNAPLEMFLREQPLPSATVIRTQAHRDIGGYDRAVAISEDVEYFLRLSLAGPWLWDDGPPVSIRRFIAPDELGHSDLHMSSQYRTLENRVVTLGHFDQFIHHMGGGKVIPVQRWKPRMGRKWFHLGRRLYREHLPNHAIHCFNQSLTYRPLSPRPRFYRLLAKRALRQARPSHDRKS